MDDRCFEITVKKPDGEEMRFKVWEESTVSDWEPVFSSILLWATYHRDNIYDLFHQEDLEREDDDALHQEEK